MKESLATLIREIERFSFGGMVRILVFEVLTVRLLTQHQFRKFLNSLILRVFSYCNSKTEIVYVDEKNRGHSDEPCGTLQVIFLRWSEYDLFNLTKTVGEGQRVNYNILLQTKYAIKFHCGEPERLYNN